MDEKEQLKLMLKKYLEVKLAIDSNSPFLEVTIFFDGEEISSHKTYMNN